MKKLFELLLNGLTIGLFANFIIPYNLKVVAFVVALIQNWRK